MASMWTRRIRGRDIGRLMYFLLAVPAILSVPALGVLILWIVTTFTPG